MGFDNDSLRPPLSDVGVISSEQAIKKERHIDLGDRYIYDPQVLQTIRRTFSTSPGVIVVDINGVVLNLGAPFKVNPHAKDVLKTLKESGYDLVAWTSAKRNQEGNFLHAKGFDRYFNMVITRENYMHARDLYLNDNGVLQEQGYDDMKAPINRNTHALITDAIQSMSWFHYTQDEKDKFMNLLITEPFLKTPQLLFPRAAIIDDLWKGVINTIERDPNEESDTFEHRLAAAKSQYPSIYVYTFDPIFATRKESTFSTGTISDVLEQFPLKQN